jgi:hypothetical protein
LINKNIFKKFPFHTDYFNLFTVHNSTRTVIKDRLCYYDIFVTTDKESVS